MTINLPNIPREVRDIIYSHFFRGKTFIQRSAPPFAVSKHHDTILLPGSPQTLFKEPVGHRSPDCFAIFRTSKELRLEAERRFYLEATFQFTPSNELHLRASDLPCDELLKRLRNIELVLSQDHAMFHDFGFSGYPTLARIEGRWKYEWDNEEYYSTVISRLGGLQTRHQTISIVIEGYEGNEELIGLSKWFESLKGLNNYSAVILRVQEADCWFTNRSRRSARNRLKCDLEPALGCGNVFEEKHASGVTFQSQKRTASLKRRNDVWSSDQIHQTRKT